MTQMRETKEPGPREVKEFYDQFFRKKKEIFPLRTYNEIKYLVPKGRLLDVACGNGYFLKTALDRGLECYGIDISEDAIRLSKEILGDKAGLKVAQAEAIPFSDRFFDYITCWGGVEHFLEPVRALEEMRRVAKDDAQ